jgi:chromosome segregation ATPase
MDYTAIAIAVISLIGVIATAYYSAPKARLAEFERMLGELRATAATQSVVIDQLQEENARLRAELDRKETQLAKLRADLDAAVLSKDQRIAELTEEAAALRAEIAGLRAELDAMGKAPRRKGKGA